MIGQAFLSGQTGQALFKSKEGVFALNARKQSTNACLKQDIDFFFDSETEIDTLENVTTEQVFGKLKNQKHCFDALNATIAGFDPILSLATRKMAIQQAESLLEDSDTYNFVQNRLFGNRVPTEADLPQALQISQTIGFHKTLHLYQCLAEKGDVIKDLQFLFENMVLESEVKSDLVSIKNSYIENGIFSAIFNSIIFKNDKLVNKSNTILLLNDFKSIVFKKYNCDSIVVPLHNNSKSESNIFVLENKLSIEQISFFRKNGYIHFKNFINTNTVKTFIGELDRIEKNLLNESVEKINGIPLKFGKNLQGNKMIHRMCFVSKLSRIFDEFLNDPRLQLLVELLAPYEGRISDDEKDGLVFNHYVNTPNSKFRQMAWHTDSPRDLFLGQKILPMLNVGIHLDNCPISNGGLRVLPGTQNQNVLKLLFGKKQFIDHSPDAREVGFEIEAGDLTIHDGRLWHRVEVSPNIGEKSRRRVLYLPIVTGKYVPKGEKSKTLFYQHFTRVIPIHK